MAAVPTTPPGEGGRASGRGRVGEVFAAFLMLGLRSFGGPVAHLGYFREAFVTRRRWIDEADYADLVALCQFLPGPASSQVGFAIGLLRAGPLGALAAWTGFTLPSAALLVAFAYGAASFSGPLGLAVIHGLKLVAVAIVAQAVLGMSRTLTPDRARAAIAVAAVAFVTFVGGGIGQFGAMVGGALAGLCICRNDIATVSNSLRFPVSRAAAMTCLASFILLLVGLPLLQAATGSQPVAIFDAFYRSGALGFGGGHVILPLLRAQVVDPGWIAEASFLAGYGAAQAVPGPLFTFAAYLGAAMQAGPGGIVGAALALVAVFLPGLLILVAALPFWNHLRSRPTAQAAMRGANAAVVGILAAALYDPVWTGAVLSPADFVVAALGFIALVSWRLPPWIVVVGVEAATVAVSLG